MQINHENIHFNFVILKEKNAEYGIVKNQGDRKRCIDEPPE